MKQQPPKAASPDFDSGENNPASQKSPRSESESGSSSSGSSQSDKRPLYNLNLTDAKLANIKSPVFLRLEAMISTLGRFREEMDGSRIPVWEQQWL